MKQVLIDLLLGLLGTFFFALIAVRSKIMKDRNINLKKFFKDNVIFWSSNLGLLGTISVVAYIQPALRTVLETFGFAVTEGNGGFFILGVVLSAGVELLPKVKKLGGKTLTP